MEQQPSYYSIMPATVRYDKRLVHKGDEKVLFSEVTALSNVQGFCYASNNYFAKLYRVEKGTISRWINHLKELGYFKVELERNERKQVVQRRIYPQADPINMNVKGGINTDVNTPINTDVNTPINTDVKGSITSINTTSINTLSRVDDTNRVREKKAKHESKFDKSKNRWIKQTSKALVDYAVSVSKERASDKRSELSYFESVMKDWSRSNVKTVEQAKHRVNWSKARKQVTNVAEPSWMREPLKKSTDAVSEKRKQELKERIRKLNEKNQI